MDVGDVPKRKGVSKVSVVQSNANYQSRNLNKVLAERNQAIVPVGSWVEGGHDILDHPFVLASLTDELQAEKQREKEVSLQRFQDDVRCRVAQQTEVGKRNQQLQKTHKMHSKGMREVRRRLAACRLIPDGEIISELPGGKWNICATGDVKEDLETEEEEDDIPFNSQHQQNANACPRQSAIFETGLLRAQVFRGPDQVTDSRVRPVLWPLSDQEELKRQHQSQFLMYRRLFMDIEREQVKEHTRHRKHQKRLARIRTKKEEIRLQEEEKLESLQQLQVSRSQQEERERAILERLRLEDEERKVELGKKKQKEKEAARFIEAQRALMKERLAQEKLDLPPFCCCGSTFWDAHPDTCANNCVFYNNPKAYIQALHSALLCLDLIEVSSKLHWAPSCKTVSPRK
ncbi:coiled-coil domain-containing protein 15 isoform 2-T2 [Polymixia lowei]